jgi:hypothetical protein
MNLLIAGLFTLAPKTDLGMVPGNPAIGKGDKSAPTTINYQAYMTHRADTTALDTVADFTFRYTTRQQEVTSSGQRTSHPFR